MCDQLGFMPVSNYVAGVGHDQVLARSPFGYRGKLWEYFVISSPTYTYELILVDRGTYTTYGPYEYLLPETSFADLLVVVRQFADQVLAGQHG